MSKIKILIVEDEFILYDEMAEFLLENNFEIAPYTKSYSEAITQVVAYKPNIVLLDINLIGEKDGIDIADQLSKEYQIPFMFITDFSDEVTFKRANRTHPSIFKSKSKPLDTKQLLLDIRVVLNNKNIGVHNQKNETEKTAIFLLKDYLNEVKNSQSTKTDYMGKELIEFTDISYIVTQKHFKNKDELKINYVLFEMINGYKYYLNETLKNLVSILPSKDFVRINGSTIINISKNNIDGRVNGSKISVNGIIFKISKTYKKNLDKRLNNLYGI
ncbi:MAG: response regulator [Flavobacteriaceae bacterium]